MGKMFIVRSNELMLTVECSHEPADTASILLPVRSASVTGYIIPARFETTYEPKADIIFTQNNSLQKPVLETHSSILSHVFFFQGVSEL